MQQAVRLRIVAVETASDAELIRRVLRKDEAAARALMQRYNRRLYRVARGVVRDDGEAEAAGGLLAGFLGACGFPRRVEPVDLANSHRAQRGASAVASAYRRTGIRHRHGSRATRRRSHSFPRVSINDRSGTGHGATAALSARRTRDRRASVRISHSPHRPGYRRHDVEETGAAFDLQPETVKTRLHRARRLLKEALAEHIGPRFGDLFPFAGQRCDRITNAVIERLNLQKGGNF